MAVTIRSSLILGLAVTLVSLLFAVSGLHRNIVVGTLVFLALVIAIDVAVIFLALRKNAGQASYGRQLLTGISIGMTGGMLVFLGSLLVTGVLFPDYLAEVRESQLEYLRAMGKSAEEIAQLEAAPSGPVGPAVQGWLGTLATSTVAAAVLGAFLRRRQ